VVSVIQSRQKSDKILWKLRIYMRVVVKRGTTLEAIICWETRKGGKRMQMKMEKATTAHRKTFMGVFLRSAGREKGGRDAAQDRNRVLGTEKNKLLIL